MEKLLLFGTNDIEYIKIKQIASRMKIKCERIEPLYYCCTLGSIESGAYKNAPFSVSPSNIPPLQTSESLLVMCGFSDKRMDKLLFELRRSDTRIDFKAILTPTNKEWTISRLLLEMHREKAAYHS